MACQPLRLTAAIKILSFRRKYSCWISPSPSLSVDTAHMYIHNNVLLLQYPSLSLSVYIYVYTYQNQKKPRFIKLQKSSRYLKVLGPGCQPAGFRGWERDAQRLGGFNVELKKSSNIRSKSTFSQGTPLKFNMEHTHGGLEDHFPF